MRLLKKSLSVVLVFTLLLGTVSLLAPQRVEAAGSKLIALTFDDGCSAYTEELLDGLARYGAKATFFVVGNYGAAAHKDLLERMVREGHQIANHTANHVVPFSGLSITGMRNELDPVNDLLYDVMGGEYQTWVRIPGGDDSSAVRQTVGSPIAYWSIDCQDWQVDDANYVYNALMSQAFDGCLTCLHDTHHTTVQAVLRAIPALQAQGYECVTVAELFRRKGIDTVNGGLYRIADGETILPGYSAPEVSTLVGFNSMVTVSAETKDDGIELFYTTDGSFPTLASSKYTQPFDVKKGTTVKIVGYDKYGTRTPLTELEAEGSLGAVFDAKYYADQYPDLKKAYGYDEEKLLNHFLATGLNEGRTASPVFSIKYYMQYKDLQEVYGTDRMKYIAHFERYGMEEGRQGIETFNVRSYRLEYQDLRRAFGDDLKAYYEHFVEFGYRENRHGTGCTTLQNPITSYQGIDYSRVYDYNYYIAHNPDVVQVLGNDDLTVLKHFIDCGMYEGRRGCDSFNVRSYQLEYGDLRKAYGDDLKSYYLHYIEFGYNEQRHGTGCTSLQDATTEYEDMDYSAIYDYEYYAAHNPDVIAAMGSDEEAVLMHFVKYGMEEGRRGNADFNVKSYKARYEDLREAYGDDWKAYYLHYINYGIDEGRRGN